MENSFVLHAPGFDLKKSVQSGQAFRWKEEGDGLWLGICRSHPVLLRQEGELLYGTADLPEAEAGPFWQNYLGIDRDYTPMEKLLEEDPCTAPCLPYSRGIRIFRQEAYETLISFILSANNNVRRISKTIESICKRFGDPVELCGRQFFSFPGATVLSSLSPQQLTDCGAGYRAPYVVQSARRIAEGYDLERLRSLDFDAVKKELLSFSGVGPKVAECIMLFSLDCERAFPVDVWVNRIVQYLYPGEEGRKAARAAAERFGCWAGAAQQYLFHYARCVGLGKPKKPSVKPTKTASTEKTKISISSTGGIGT